MGYLGSQATFTGTQNHKRISKTATQGQKDFTVDGGYDIGAIDVFRNGVRLVGQRDFSALDGVTVTLATGASADDILEFVTFVNFKVDDVVNKDGDSVIKGNVTISGDLGITGSLNATVSNTATSGFSTASGISTQVSGFLGVGVTGTNLNVTGVITANSFSGDGSGLTGIAATDNVSTNGLVVLGISTLSGAVSVGDTISLGDHDRLRFGAGNDLQIYHDGSNSIIKDNGTGKLILDTDGAAIEFQKQGLETIATFNSDGAVELYHNNSLRLETTVDGIDLGSVATGAVGIVTGTTGERPASPKAGDFRYNLTTGEFEGYTDSWGAIAGSGGGASETDTSVSSTSATSIFTTAHATNRSVSAIIQITQGSSYQVGRYLVIHDGTTATIIEESAVATGDMLGSFTADINSTNLRILVNMNSASSATVTILPTVVTV